MGVAKQEQARIEQQIRTYEARLESSPMVEEEYKQVTRDMRRLCSSITLC